MENEFVDILGFEGLYKINRDGIIKNGNHIKMGYTDSRGYIQLKLWSRIDKKFHNKYLHRILAETFIPNPENKPTVDHVDINTSNNDLSNLRWATHLEQAYNTSRSVNKTPEEKKLHTAKYKYEWRVRNKIYLSAAKELREIEA